ncbi:predicted protein [Histoplasma mississippiense (nom. inval.)]|uniref:predicted protein n=1 Tax=Ajellomyces capsulatus (strain NAm1 / WU24) TaxID=2059318 RepID=UPI000157CD91|nr:predicted protein [Histoplasma mississippiense (nom. inval.)]EDN10389.1 predicted protein [Histoplasma mississippiense (nom. inval.)]
MERANKPTAIPVSSPLPQPSISVEEDKVQASLASGDSVIVNLLGATVVSWKLANGDEQLFLSEKAVLDGSKPIRGGIPLVFPVFGPPPKTMRLPRFPSTDLLVTHIGNSWGNHFGSEGQNGDSSDITKTRILNLQSKTYVDKVLNASTHVESSRALAITQETDRVYQSLNPTVPIVVADDDNNPVFSIYRESLNDIVVWNPWIEKAKGMADFAPDDGYKNMICVEAGSVVGWQTLEAGESWECGQTVKSKL